MTGVVRIRLPRMSSPSICQLCHNASASRRFGGTVMCERSDCTFSSWSSLRRWVEYTNIHRATSMKPPQGTKNTVNLQSSILTCQHLVTSCDSSDLVCLPPHTLLSHRSLMLYYLASPSRGTGMLFSGSKHLFYGGCTVP